MNTTRLTSLNNTLSRLAAHDVLAFGARLSLAAIFLLSARTKVDGWFHLTDNAVALFDEEYRLPWISALFAAQLATVAEHLIAAMLAIGLGTRLAAAGLLVMTLVIQLLVYPAAWPTHLSWATLALYLIGNGGGRTALDYWLVPLTRTKSGPNVVTSLIKPETLRQP
ncbi:DoxX family protein [Massilia sp. DJPM01]|uniref:DoxX family protein n=1 Tax=Massilia sp. DJPM01 TaxID=3024404 RepID=UPI00259DF9FD|nr:DoxX family protein [Massilia sp. DJPM01]MDM5179231.1 DoxX family protein [Massilia sp. DJPM01]